MTRPRLAQLTVASPAHGQLRVRGLARYFPAGMIYVQRCTAVQDGDFCRLQSIDHYHLYRMTVSLGPLLTDKLARQALQRLLAKPTDGGRIADLQRELQRLRTPAPDRRDQEPTQRSIQVQASHLTSFVSCAAVQKGDGSQMDAVSHWVIEESVVPIVDLLATDSDLVQSFALALVEKQPGPQRATFREKLWHASRRLDDLALLDHATDLDTPGTWLVGGFGFAAAGNASTVQLGTGNKLMTGMHLDRPTLSHGSILADLAQIRRKVKVPAKPPDAVAEAPDITPKANARVPAFLSPPASFLSAPESHAAQPEQKSAPPGGADTTAPSTGDDGPPPPRRPPRRDDVPDPCGAYPEPDPTCGGAVEEEGPP